MERKCSCGGRLRVCAEVVEKVGYYPTKLVNGEYVSSKTAMVKTKGWGDAWGLVCVKCKDVTIGVREQDIDWEEIL